MRWVWSRVAAAIAACSGVVAGLLVNIDRGLREEQILGDVLANYFSLFTIVSSILCIGELPGCRSVHRAAAVSTPMQRIDDTIVNRLK